MEVMRIYALFDDAGFSTGEFFDEVSHPPVVEMVPVRSADAPDDMPEGEWPLERRFVRRNDAIPAQAEEITEAERAAIIAAPQFLRRVGGAMVALPVPAVPVAVPAISDRQFAQVLALDGTITQAEALAWAAHGELPKAMTDALAQIPEAGGRRFGAHMMLAAATTYERHHPLTVQFGALLTNPATGKAYDAAALDALWTRAAAL